MPKTFGNRWENVKDLPGGGQAWINVVSDSAGEFDGEYILKRLKSEKRLVRFEDEIQTLMELDHPNITKLVDFSLEEKHPWFVQEYCTGGDLYTYVTTRSEIDPIIACDFFIQLVNALEYAHSKGKIHRDIKPHNIFLRDGETTVVLGDFGLCWFDNKERITLTEEAVGSFKYMAPELADGKLEKPDWKVDVYSLGKVLYFMLSGGRIYDREKHREKEWNLKHLADDIRLEHANNLIDHMVVEEPNKRIPIDMVYKISRQMKKQIEGSYAPLDGAINSQCNYCGLGVYVPVAFDEDGIKEFLGLQTTAVTRNIDGFRAVMCNRCGNVLIFANQHLENPWFPSKEEIRKYSR